VLTALLL
jgi:hypothetical protein